MYHFIGNEMKLKVFYSADGSVCHSVMNTCSFDVQAGVKHD